MATLPKRTETVEGDVVTAVAFAENDEKQVVKITTAYRMPAAQQGTLAQQRVAARRKLPKFGLAEGQAQGFVDPSTTLVAVETIRLTSPDADSGDRTQEQLDKIAAAVAGVAFEGGTGAGAKSGSAGADAAQSSGGGGAGGSGGGGGRGGGAAGSMCRVSSLERLAAAGGKAPAGRYVPPSMRGKGGGGGGGGGGGREEHSDATVRVTNVAEAVSEADLRELCGRFGCVTRLYMAKDKQQMEGRPNRGFAFVTFASRAEAGKAMELLQGYGFDDIVLKIEWAKQNNDRERNYDRSAESVMSKHMTGYGKALAQDTTQKVSYSSSAKHNAI